MMESTSEFDDDDKNKDCFDDGEFKPMEDIDPGEVSDDYNKIEQNDISNVKCTSVSSILNFITFEISISYFFAGPIVYFGDSF